MPAAVNAGSAAGLDTWAVVNADGALVRGKGFAGGDPASHAADGVYNVVFNRDVRACGYVATLGHPSTGGPPSGQISVASHPTNVAAVRVRTENDAGAAADRGFHLAVTC